MVKKPVKKSDYLNYGEGPTLDKVEQLISIQKFIGDVKIKDVKVTVLQFGDKLERKLTDFPPNHLDGEESAVEYVDNLLYTAELNPPEEIILTLPDGTEFFIFGGEPDEVLDECYDVHSKLEDIIDTLRAGKELDSTQDAFLRMYNIIE